MARAAAEFAATSQPMPTPCDPWPGKTAANAHLCGPSPRDRAPREAAAEADEDDQIAGLNSPRSTVSESAIGIDAADVLPYSAMLTTTLSSGRPKIPRGCVDDAPVGLMRNQERDVGFGEVRFA